MLFLKPKNIMIFFFALLAAAYIFVWKLGQDIDNQLATDLVPSKNLIHREVFIPVSRPPRRTISTDSTSARQVNQDTPHHTPLSPPHKTQIFIENQSDVYIKFSGMDIPRDGDFPCANSLARDCCLIQRKKMSDFELFCDRIGPYCKGFVFKRDSKHEVAYFKRKLGHFKPNRNTDLFLKREFVEKAGIKYQ